MGGNSVVYRAIDRLLEQRLAAALRPRELEAHLRECLGRTDELEIVSQATGGHSNITALIRFGEDEWVVRRPPTGELRPTAHDVLREFRYISALAPTAVPVPRPVLACADRDVIGAPFYVMERVAGLVFDDGFPPEFADADRRRRLCESALDTLAALHSIDWTELGLAARPGNYLERQVRRWRRQLQLTPTASRLEGIDRVSDWLAANLPSSTRLAVVHGDFEFPNLVVTEPPSCQVAAVLDWEMATIGDPLADLFWFVKDWSDVAPESVIGKITSGPGIPSRATIVDRYQRRTGASARDAQFYLALALWKEATILEGLYADYLDGHASTDKNERFEAEVPRLVERALRAIEADPDDVL